MIASMMVQDHTRARNKLEEIAHRENVEMESKSDDTARDDIDKLSKLFGRDFDKDYIDLMVKDHKDAVDSLQDQAENGDNTAVKPWAAETLPRVKHHLELAQLQSQLNRANDTASNRVNPVKGKSKG